MSICSAQLRSTSNVRTFVINSAIFYDLNVFKQYRTSREFSATGELLVCTCEICNTRVGVIVDCHVML